MSVLRIDTDRYVEAAGLECAAGHGISAAARMAETSLYQSSGMAGWDAMGAQWAASYDPVAAEVLVACHELAMASSDSALALTLAAGRYISAEHVASMGLSAFFTPPSPAPVAEGTGAGLPSAGAPTPGWPPVSWDIIAGIAGVVWPAGDPDLLRRAGAAWTKLADDIEAAVGGPAAGALSAISTLQSEDLALFHERSVVVRHSAALIAQTCRDIAAGCEALAAAVETAHQELIDETEAFALECATLAAVGIGFSFLTLGGSAAITSLVGAARTAQMVARVHAVLSRLSFIARTAAVVGTRLPGTARLTRGLRMLTGQSAGLRPALLPTTRVFGRSPGVGASSSPLSRLAPAVRVLSPIGTAGLRVLDSRAVSVALSSPAALLRGQLSLPVRRSLLGSGAVKGSASDQVFALLRQKGVASPLVPAAETAVRTKDRLDTVRGLAALPGSLRERYGPVTVETASVRGSGPGRLTMGRASPVTGPRAASSPAARTSRPAASP
ncbi:hypothetical protein E8P82_00400 [Arthrobacter echini]|uniref:Outer membrane channel protein CpnT-like N-terminal domain-containing protein n=1 Tax=Arthrobacter echini TaxID=1529066 RepID=A0A4S5E9M6_9MICC|nr:hypothetical protein [Arthrobacter echini]THJ68416.1 hypothetical protein E8P82_00400 [Arthrobacter echini]